MSRPKSIQHLVCSFVGHEVAFSVVPGSVYSLPSCRRCGRATGHPGYEV